MIESTLNYWHQGETTMTNKIYAFCGLSGTGKTTVARIISEFYDLPFIVSCTTRPMRPGEKDGKDYHFVDDHTWNKLSKKEALVATQEFKVACGSVWKYGIKRDDLKDSCIMVLTPSGIHELIAAGYNVVSFYITMSEETRLKRISCRNDNQSHAEIARRTKADKAVFKKFSPDYIIDNSGELTDTILYVAQQMGKEKSGK